MEIFIIVLVFLIIGIIIDKNDHKNIINPYLFGLSVSIDSFIIGFTVRKKYIVISSLIFSIVSFMFTIVGFKLGKEITKKLNNKSKIISVFILIFLLIYNLLNYVKA